MLVGTYIGPYKKAQGEKALLRRHTYDTLILAQFNNKDKFPYWAFGWTPFKRTDFEIEEITDEPEPESEPEQGPEPEQGLEATETG